MVEDFLAFLQTITLVNGFLVKTTIKTFVAMVLEDCEIKRGFNPCLLGRFHQVFIVFFKLIAQKKALLIFP